MCLIYHNISTMFLSQPYDLQKSLCDELVFDDEFHKIKRIRDCTSNDNDDFKNAKIYKIYNVLNNILYIGVTCDALKTWI
jgi:hypothetical protein